ncbi:FAD:protein FMN transferase [Gemmobacter lutimaris]|uniref:FAD:protein FMN transferase n=1 Tax=Gemmobacter lutimaris TaxID=2306023 RepID=A0A398BU83_9RHOB|nr:FAD:protein FMN transferase [Gemmobacter lutimaris]RID92481.1 FAD:protein FMN transferase [Gemmobacter lutimaris]
MIGRRRFLQIAAATAILPGRARAEARWQGQALGADCDVLLAGPGAEAALAGIPALMERVEAAFSLYRDSELTRLNSTGQLAPSAIFAGMLALSDRLHRLTGGAFDPSVQPLWQALRDGRDPGTVRGAVGWQRIARRDGGVQLAPGQALTFNGVAQGYASDLVRDYLARRGFERALVNMGEYAALGGPFRLGIADPMAGELAEWHLRGTALALSAPGATLIGGAPHIQHPQGLAPLWSSVAVEADSAALADGLSTALVFLDQTAVNALRKRLPGVHRVAFVDAQGGLTSL